MIFEMGVVLGKRQALCMTTFLVGNIIGLINHANK